MTKLRARATPPRPADPAPAPRPSRLRRRLLTAGLVALAAGGWVGGAELLAERKLRAAVALAQKRDFPEARRRLDELLRSDPTSGRLLFEAGRAARRDGDPFAARLLLDRAAGAGWPADAVGAERALLAAQEGAFAAMEPKLRQALDAAPDHPDADLLREVLVPGYLAQFELVQAYQVLTDWVGRSPGDARARLWLADVDRKLLLPVQAIENALVAAESAPDDPAARRLAAELMVENHRPAEARPHFDWLLARDASDPAALLGRACCLRELGDTASAAAELDRLIEARPRDAKALAERGYCDLALGKPADAAARLAQSAELAPGEPEVLYNLAAALELAGRPAEAKAARERHARADADLAELRAVAKSISADPRNPDLRVRAGELMLRNGQASEGVRWLESALAIDPRHPGAAKTLAEYRPAAK